MTGKERVISVLNGEKADRHPYYDILRGDKVIEYLTGMRITEENSSVITKSAVRNGLDSTRGVPKIPSVEQDAFLNDGRKVQYRRWTRWIEHNKYRDIYHYIDEKKKLLRNIEFSGEEIAEVKKVIDQYIDCEKEYFSEIAFFWHLGSHSKEQFGFDGNGHIPMMLTDIYSEIGLEEFSYYINDDSSIFSELLEYYTQRSIQAINLIPDESKPFGIIYADDIAFKSGPLLNPAFFEKEYYYRLKRIVDACHKRNILVLFHSDGNLYKLLDGLVDAGIDFLNPIEVAAGMDIKEIHRRYPKLVMAGGIDASQLLPYGSEVEVKYAVKKAIDDAEGKILIGSSTEIGDTVPLRNFIALKEALSY